MIPTPGRIVEYTLTEDDVRAINGRQGRIAATEPSVAAIALLPNHNPLHPGDTYPMVIIRAWGDTEDSAVNGQVLLDGDHAFWATSRQQGDGPGQWHAYPRVGA